MLKPFNHYNGVFVEITKSEHEHGGKGWEFGTCLWSPTTNRSGADRYSIMRAPVRGDLTLHFYEHTWSGRRADTRLCGYSIVAKPFKLVNQEPPAIGNWSGRESYYRIELKNYSPFTSPLPLTALVQHYGDEIRADIVDHEPVFYPFTTHGDSVNTVQGIYLARCTPSLYDILMRGLGLQEVTEVKDREEVDLHFEYSEARRRASEKYFFARNPKLTKLAKKHHGTVCQGCGFDFSNVYGELGEGYIEAHHLNPLSERAEKEWSNELRTSLAEVTVLCANCHRMIHRKRPALTLELLKATIAKARSKTK